MPQTRIRFSIINHSMIFKTFDENKIVKSISQYQKLGNAIERYNGLQKKSQSFQTAYNRSLQNSNSTVGKYLSSLNGAKASMGGYIKYLASAKASTIALTAASTAMNIAITAGISIGVGLLVNQINKWIHAQEEARQKSIELTNTYKEQRSSLDEQVEKYKELKETLDNGNLSTDESRSIKEQLLEIQNSLIESYGNEAENLNLVNGKYKEQLGLLSELSKEKATDYVIENRDVFEDAKDALEKTRTYNIGQAMSYEGVLPSKQKQQEFLDFLETYNELLVINKNTISSRGYAGTTVNLSVKADVESADDLMHQFAEDLEKYGKENDIDVSGLLEGISEQLKETWTEELTDYKTIYDEFMKAEVVRSDDLRPLYQDSIEAVENYNKALASGEGVEEAKANLDSVRESVSNATTSLEGSQDVFDGIYEGINKDAEAAYNLSQQFETNDNVKNFAEQLKGLTDVDLVAINFENGITEPGEEAFGELMKLLGLTTEDTQKLIDKLVELGYVAGKVQGSTSHNESGNLWNTTKQQSFLDSMSKVKSSYDTLLSAQKEFEENSGKISSDTLSKLLENDLLQYLEYTSDGLQINTQALRDQEQALKDTAVSELYAAMCNDIKNLSLGKTTELSEIAKTALANLDSVATTAGQNAAIASNGWWEYGAAISSIPGIEGLSGDTYKDAMAIVEQYKNIAQSIYNTSFDVGSSSAAKKATDILNAELDVLDARMDAGLIDFNTYINKRKDLIEDYYNSGKIEADEYYDYLNKHYEKELSYMDKIASAVQNRLDKEIDSIEAEIENIEKSNKLLEEQLDEYDKVLSVVEEVYDAEIDRIKSEQDAIQEKIDLLQEENDESKKAIELEKARYELERLRSQRTKKIYAGDKGYIYDVDHSAIRDAEDSLADLELEQTISALEKEKEALDESIEELEKYKDLWGEIANAKEDAENKMLTSSIFGAEYEKIILNSRTEDIEAFKDKYIAVQEQIDDNTSLIESYEEKITYYEGLKEQWSELTKSYEEEQELLLLSQYFGADYENQILSGRIDNLKKFESDYRAVQQAITDTAIQAANARIKAYKEEEKGAGGNYIDNVTLGTTSQKTRYDREEKLFNESFKGTTTPSEKTDYSKLIFHTGLDNGYVGSESSLSEDERLHLFQDLAGDKLLPNEIPAILERGEIVINRDQQWNMAKNVQLLYDRNLFRHSIPNRLIGNDKITPVVQNITLTLPNVTNNSGYERLQKELRQMQIDALQIASKR